MIDCFGHLAPDVARGIGLRHDRRLRYRANHFLGSIAWLGIQDDAAVIGEPETNGCAERWIRTLEEPCLWARTHQNVDDLRAAAADVKTHNHEWLIQRHGHRTPGRPPSPPSPRRRRDSHEIGPSNRGLQARASWGVRAA